MTFDLETETEFETDVKVADLDLAAVDTVEDENSIDEFESTEFIEDVFDISDVDPELATDAKPGSDDKVLMLAARYAAGLPLWHNSDCYDHGPGLKHLLELEN